MRTIVVDTSTLLTAGTELIETFDECVFVIPSVVVRELEDNRAKPTVGFLAREWLRLLEDLRKVHGSSVREGVFVTDTVGIRVEPNHSNQTILPVRLRDGSNDSTVLAVAEAFENEGHDVLLLSNDTPMRISATLDLGLDSEEFSLAEIRSTRCFDGRSTVETSGDLIAEQLNEGNDSLSIARSVVSSVESLPSHCVLDVKLDDGSIYGSFLKWNCDVQRLPSSMVASSVVARNLEQRIALSYLKASAESLPVVSVNGSAGTGKTLLTLAAALEAKAQGHFKKVIVFRSLHEMGQGQELGFLPGDVNDKMSAWSGAVKDAFDVLMKNDKNRSKDIAREVEVAPITFLRGRSLADTFIILDEAQNFSRKEILNVMSRVGQGSKIVIVSDVDQVDNRFLQTGSKSDIWTIVEDLKDDASFAHVTLKKTERSRVAETAAKLLAND